MGRRYLGSFAVRVREAMKYRAPEFPPIALQTFTPTPGFERIVGARAPIGRLFRFTSVLALVLTGVPTQASETNTYTYDALGRLVLVSSSGGPRDGHATTTAYDAVGNRTQVAVNLPPPPQITAVTFSLAGPGTMTKGSTATFTVSKSGSAYNPVSVNFGTADGSATAPADYAANSGTLTFQAAETQKTFTIAVTDDGNASPSKQFSVNLGSPSTGGSIGSGSSTVTIPSSPGTRPITQNDYLTTDVCTASTIDVVANDTDPMGGSLTLVSVSGAYRGQATIYGGRIIRYVSRGQQGGDQVTYVVQSSSGHTATGYLTVQIIDQGGCQ